jgi:hypothetical protein
VDRPDSPSSPPALLTEEEAAAALRISRSTFRRLRKSGALFLPKANIGVRLNRYHPDHVARAARRLFKEGEL